jgi:hypothetical protein
MTNTTITSGKLTIVNPSDRTVWPQAWLITLGAYGERRLVVWADGADSALDEAIDWAVDHAPGYLADESVAEEYQRALAEGLDDDAARERAEEDTTCGGNCGNYINSWEWTIDEADRAMLIAMRD